MAVPTTGILDDFERANEDPLDNGTWDLIVPGGINMRTASTQPSGYAAQNQASGGSQTTRFYWSAQSFGSTQEVHVKLSGGADGDPQLALGENYRLMICLQDVGGSNWDGYQLVIASETGDDHWYIRRVTNGATAAETSVVQDAVYWKRVLFKTDGSTVEGWGSNDDWASSTLVISRSDSTYTSGYIGMGIQSNTTATQPQFDEYGGGDPVEFIPQIYRRTFSSRVR